MNKKIGFIKETWKISRMGERISIITCLMSIIFFILAGTYTSITGALFMTLILIFNIDSIWQREETKEIYRHLNTIACMVNILVEEREDKNNDIR
ncbi:MAG: hypothetical protein ACRCVJ_18380 [Clostridium sp.]|uniref:hypothetical protein n=1 Tax=Clostridium sp. TaxID=1506 RepID=UPI003F36E23F